MYLCLGGGIDINQKIDYIEKDNNLINPCITVIYLIPKISEIHARKNKRFI